MDGYHCVLYFGSFLEPATDRGILSLMSTLSHPPCTRCLCLVCRHRALLRPPRPHSHGRGRRRSIWYSASFRMTFLFYFRCTRPLPIHFNLNPFPMHSQPALSPSRHGADGANPLDPRTNALGVNLSATSITKTHCKRPRNGTNPRASTRTPLLRHSHSHHHHHHTRPSTMRSRR